MMDFITALEARKLTERNEYSPDIHSVSIEVAKRINKSISDWAKRGRSGVVYYWDIPKLYRINDVEYVIGFVKEHFGDIGKFCVSHEYQTDEYLGDRIRFELTW